MSSVNQTDNSALLKRVTYLLGAGASADALPTIKDMGNEVKAIIARLLVANDEFSKENNPAATERIKTAIYDLRILADACENHTSIDTYARMLYVNKQDAKYKKIKNIIILFFELYYYYHRKIDKRYDSFFAHYLNREHPRFPKHVNVISWNYDYEFEKAFSKYYILDKALEEIYSELIVHHKGLHKKPLDFENFNLVKLNGTVGYRYLGDTILLGICNYYYKSQQDKDMNYAIVCPTIAKHANLEAQYEPLISFAWEDEASANDTINKAVEIMKTTAILVVVGYSFPEFNRVFDSMLLNENATQRIQKIYVQDNDPHAIIDKIKEYRFSWDDVEFIPVIYTAKFYIPHQLSYNS